MRTKLKAACHFEATFEIVRGRARTAEYIALQSGAGTYKYDVRTEAGGGLKIPKINRQTEHLFYGHRLSENCDGIYESSLIQLGDEAA